ncbi:MAG: TonB-dependent receptor [Gammaproteobacteria bacterium]|nr:TonB-dependent receptor [Gammaproteobacteria bacterium]
MKRINKHPGKLSKLAWPIAAIVSLTPGLLSTPVLAQGSIEEIVVTAQRREQAIQDVPISITAFNAEDLTNRGVETVDQLDLMLPNVMIRGGGTTGPTSGNFTMRGVPGVARYLDGVAQTGMQGSLANIVELERIEVLKGPQGTLFGKNAMGGAISFVSRAPAEEMGARINVTAGNFNQRAIRANIDVPITPNFLTKLTYFTNQKDGFVQSGNAQIQHGDENDTVIRLDALWHASSDVSVRFDLTSTVRNPNHPNADVLYDVNDNQAFAKQMQAIPGVNFTDATQAFGGREEYRNTSTYSGPGWDFKGISYNATVNWNISDTLSLRSITGIREYNSAALADLDATQYQFFEIFSGAEVEEASQEIQLLSDGDRLDWVVGLYINDVEQLNRRFDWQFEPVANNTGTLVPLVYPGGPLAGLPFRSRNQITENNREDRSLFFEVDYEVSDRMNLTVGGRYSEEDFAGGSWLAADAEPTWPNTSFSYTKGNQTSDSAANFYAFTPRVSLDYAINDDIMVYASYSEGFNGGGVNTNPIAGVFTSFTGERLNQVEVGVRSMLFDNSLRLNASFFSGTWEDIQVGEAIVPGQITQQNAGEAEMEGFEIDALWAATDNFTVNASAGWLSTAYTDVGAATTIGLGSSFAFAPDFQAAVGGQYDWHIDSGATMSYRLDYGWTSKYVTIQDIRLQKVQPEYGLLSGRITYQPADANWSYALWGRNLTSEWYQQGGFGAFLGGVDQGIVARPREFGITVNLEF